MNDHNKPLIKVVKTYPNAKEVLASGKPLGDGQGRQIVQKEKMAGEVDMGKQRNWIVPILIVLVVIAIIATFHNILFCNNLPALLPCYVPCSPYYATEVPEYEREPVLSAAPSLCLIYYRHTRPVAERRYLSIFLYLLCYEPYKFIPVLFRIGHRVFHVYFVSITAYS